MIKLVSRSKHINPVTGFEIPDESIIFFDSCIIEEDDVNYHVGNAWEPKTEVFAKARWERR